MAGRTAEELADDQLSAVELEQLSITYHDVPIDGREVRCVDIRDASALLARSEDTLRRRHRKGEIHFVLHEGRRYLPLEHLPAARVVVRSMKEWQQILGVSRQTVYTWMSELPEDLDPLEMEARLLQRAREKRR